MEFKYVIKGVTLGENEMRDIHQYYEILCTAEYLLENYDFSEGVAMELASQIRRYMDKYDVTESEAICVILSEVKL